MRYALLAFQIWSIFVQNFWHSTQNLIVCNFLSIILPTKLSVLQFIIRSLFFLEEKGPSFRLLVNTMKSRGNEQLYKKEKVNKTYGKAAQE